VTKKSEIPFGAQFSPNQVDLPGLLRIIHDCAGDRNKTTEVIRDDFFATHSQAQRWKLADNTVLALRVYGLLDEDGATPTTLAGELLAIATTPDMLYERFAKHILVNLRGIPFVETLEIMQTAGEKITLHTLRKRLEQRGLHVPRGAVHLSSMRLWLAQAGIFDASVKGGPRLYEVDQVRLNEILGIGLDAIDSLTQLNASQRAFLRALTRIAEPDPFVANKIADLASALYAVEYNHKELPKSVLFPLRDLEYIQVTKTTTGRGAKPYEVSRTPKFHREISEPILVAAAEKAGLVPKEVFELPLAQILTGLKSSNKHVKGKALELLAIYLTRLIDLDFKGWRTRSADTGGAEVDVIVEGARLIFSRWQIQAKNTKTVRLGDVAKEVGLSLTFVYSNVVMIVTTGDFTKDAYSYAQHVMKTCNLNVILLNGSELERISRDPTDIVAVLNSKAEQAMKVKERTDYFAAQ
jgi:site-specific DNA-methyltransferase (cytosine-N4-specific)